MWASGLITSLFAVEPAMVAGDSSVTGSLPIPLARSGVVGCEDGVPNPRGRILAEDLADALYGVAPAKAVEYGETFNVASDSDRDVGTVAALCGELPLHTSSFSSSFFCLSSASRRCCNTASAAGGTMAAGVPRGVASGAAAAGGEAAPNRPVGAGAAKGLGAVEPNKPPAGLAPKSGAGEGLPKKPVDGAGAPNPVLGAPPNNDGAGAVDPNKPPDAAGAGEPKSPPVGAGAGVEPNNGAGAGEEPNNPPVAGAGLPKGAGANKLMSAHILKKKHTGTAGQLTWIGSKQARCWRGSEKAGRRGR